MKLKHELQAILTDEQISKLTAKELKTLKWGFEVMYNFKTKRDGSRIHPYAGFMAVKNLLEPKFGLILATSDFGESDRTQYDYGDPSEMYVSQRPRQVIPLDN